MESDRNSIFKEGNVYVDFHAFVFIPVTFLRHALQGKFSQEYLMKCIAFLPNENRARNSTSIGNCTIQRVTLMFLSITLSREQSLFLHVSRCASSFFNIAAD